MPESTEIGFEGTFTLLKVALTQWMCARAAMNKVVSTGSPGDLKTTTQELSGGKSSALTFRTRSRVDLGESASVDTRLPISRVGNGGMRVRKRSSAWTNKTCLSPLKAAGPYLPEQHAAVRLAPSLMG